MSASENGEAKVEPWEDHPWREAWSGLPLYLSFPTWFLLVVVRVQSDDGLTSAQCILHKLTPAKPKYDYCGSFSKLYIRPPWCPDSSAEP